MRRLSWLGRPAVSIVSALVLMSCGGREFRTEQETIAHFKDHRQGFERAAEMFLAMKSPTIKIEERPVAAAENPLVQLARELRVSNISAVPSAAAVDEQWIEFTLPARYMRSTYGLIFVPHGHESAFSAVTSYVASPPKTMRVVRPIEERWFYYEYS